MIKRAAVVLMLAVLAGCSKPAASSGPVLKFSILSTENAQAQETKWRPFIADMARQTGMTVEPYYASNYTSLIEAMRFKQTDAGWFSNQPGLEAVRRSGGEVFARTSHPGGKDGYNAVIIVKKGSGLTLERLLTCDRTLNFGMGDAKSTSGTLAPMTYLFQPRGLDPQTCFKTVRSAKHEANLLSVAMGLLDASTNNTNDFERLARRGDAQAKKTLDAIQVVWTSPSLPEDPLVWRKDLSSDVKDKLRRFFLTYGVGETPEAARQRQVLADLNMGLFHAADDSHLLPVRQMEAAEQVLAARRSGDPAALAKAQASLDDLTRQIKAGQP